MLLVFVSQNTPAMSPFSLEIIPFGHCFTCTQKKINKSQFADHDIFLCSYLPFHFFFIFLSWEATFQSLLYSWDIFNCFDLDKKSQKETRKIIWTAYHNFGSTYGFHRFFYRWNPIIKVEFSIWSISFSINNSINNVCYSKKIIYMLIWLDKCK